MLVLVSWCKVKVYHPRCVCVIRANKDTVREYTTVCIHGFYPYCRDVSFHTCDVLFKHI